jgi:hydroxyacylglutathione hydrolase
MYKYYAVTKLGELNNNAYVIVDEQNDGIIVDPSFGFEQIKKITKENRINVKYIILTHLHYDHYYDLLSCLNYYNLDKVYFDEQDLKLIESPGIVEYLESKNFSMQQVDQIINMKANIYDIDLPNVQVLDTPGHSPGSVSIIFADKFILTGDTIFRKVYGLTNLYLSSKQDLIESCIKILNLNLPENIELLPGHGRFTTLLRERRTNQIIGEINEENINWENSKHTWD